MKNNPNKKIKVVHIITRFDKGGSAENTLLTILGLNRKKYNILLIKGSSLESKMSNEESLAVNESLKAVEAHNIRVINLPSLVRKISPLKDLRAFFSLFQILRKERPDIVHTHTSKAGFLGRWASFLARVPIIIHTPHGHVFHSYFGPVLTKFFIITEKISSLITDKIITLTNRERDEHIERGIAPLNKFITIYSGVDLNRFMNLNIDMTTKKKDLNIPQDFYVIGTIGRLVPIKGHKYLVAASQRVLEEFPKTVFVFVGDGSLKSELERQAKDLGVKKNIVFTGWRKDIPEILSLFDILVFPSLNEGMGRVMIEGMSLGKPIVASNVGGIRDLIKDGENGILVPPKDSDALGKALSRLMRNKRLAEGLGKIGEMEVYPDFDASTMIKKIDNLYESLLSNVN